MDFFFFFFSNISYVNLTGKEGLFFILRVVKDKGTERELLTSVDVCNHGNVYNSGTQISYR